MKKHLPHVLLLLIVCAIVFGFKLGDYDFWGRHGEARRAEVSREMVVSGNWLVPHLNGEPFVTKPPLYYWAAAAMFELTGRFDELSARIPSVIAGTLGVFVTYCWANAMFSARIGCFAGIILATSFLYGGMARTAGLDMMLTLFTTAALYFFTLGYLRRQIAANLSGKWNLSTGMYLLSAFCIGLATMTKNPIGFAVPLLAIGAFILLTRDFKLLLETKPWWLLLVFLLVVLPWFVMVYARVPDFFDILHQETLGRYIDPEGTPHYEPFYYYIPALGAFAPWVIFLPGMIISLISKKLHQISRSHLLIIVASVTTFLLFSSVGSKREYYLLPIYPFLAILVAKYWDEYLEIKRTTNARWIEKGMAIPFAGFAGLLCLVGVALPMAAHIYLPAYLLLSVLFGLLFLASGMFLFHWLLHGNVSGTFAVFSIATILIYVFVLLTIVPETNVYRSRKTFFNEVAAIAGEHKIIDYNYEGFDAQFYLQRIVPVAKEIEDLAAFADLQKPVFIIMTSEQYDHLQQNVPELAHTFEQVLQRTWRSAINPGRTRSLVLLKTL
ncbi:hypothetical protein U27_02257 [Candidatus Vecturithrix granuli]|uniref:ArnT-like N-terminal domain-containing protein n=1 Tax=Vecturithrix granuli TaxID=1499967 RepID=A0A0S6W6Y4_VECG1|nr:hypothetical protein U27_02257 [Candidatus Vecturithrix granuli]